MGCGEEDTGKKWIVAAVTHLLFVLSLLLFVLSFLLCVLSFLLCDDRLLLDETDGRIGEGGRGEGGQRVAFAIGVFSIRLMIVDHQFCMAAHSAEKDLFPATKGALVRRLSAVPLAGEEGIPPRFLEKLWQGHFRLWDVEDISRQSMQRTPRHHHVAARRADRPAGRSHAVGRVEGDTS